MKVVNEEKKELDKVLEDMSSDAALDAARGETEEDMELAWATKDLKVVEMFVKVISKCWKNEYHMKLVAICSHDLL